MTMYYVKSTDVSAPSSQGVNGQGITLLDYILVTRAGLTKLFAGTNKGVYQFPNGQVLRAVHDSAVSGDARLMVVRGAESASAVDTIVNPYPTVADETDANSNWLMSSTASNVARAWWALVDTTRNAFHLFIDTGSNNTIQGGGFWFSPVGIMAADTTYNSCLWTKNSTSAVSSNPSQTFGVLTNIPANGRLVWDRSRDGTIKGSYGFLGPVINGGGQSNPVTVTAPAYPHPDGTKLHKQKVFAGDQYALSTVPGTSALLQRGWVPDLWMGLHSSYASISIGQTFDDTAYNAAALFAWFPFGASTTGTNGVLILEISDTWAVPGV